MGRGVMDPRRARWDIGNHLCSQRAARCWGGVESPGGARDVALRNMAWSGHTVGQWLDWMVLVGCPSFMMLQFFPRCSELCGRPCRCLFAFCSSLSPYFNWWDVLLCAVCPVLCFSTSCFKNLHHRRSERPPRPSARPAAHASPLQATSLSATSPLDAPSEPRSPPCAAVPMPHRLFLTINGSQCPTW